MRRIRLSVPVMPLGWDGVKLAGQQLPIPDYCFEITSAESAAPRSEARPELAATGGTGA